MKIRIDLVDGLEEEEIIIRCSRVDDTVARIQKKILEEANGRHKLVFYKDGDAYYFPLEDVLFFETDGDHVYAHTANDAYRIRYRLYELEEMLPSSFVRIAKSAIVNTAKIYSVARDLTASSRVQFSGTHKQIYVSRRYYQNLRQRLQERSPL